MSAIPDGTAASSWMQRARAEDHSRQQKDDHVNHAVNPRPRSPGDGWDPYEVWLSRIERPRRRRTIVHVA